LMSVQPTGLSHINQALHVPIRNYAALLVSLGGSNVRAITLYGAVVAGTFDPQRHSVRSVLVLESVDLEMLRRLAEHGLKLGKARIAAPLVMTAEYIKRSLDTFPLEMIEIQEQHVAILGEDYFADLSFEDAHVRLQCERELKTILIGLRQGLLSTAGRDKLLAHVEVGATEGLMRTLRGLLWLKGHQAATPAAEVVAEVEKIAGRPLPMVRDALGAAHLHRWNEFKVFYEEVAALGKAVDEW